MTNVSNNYEKIASEFADRIMNCNNKDELWVMRLIVRAYMKEHPEFKKEWKPWLSGIRDSRLDSFVYEANSGKGLK